MTPEQRAEIDRIVQFQADLRKYADMLDGYEQKKERYEQSNRSGLPFPPSEEINALRQSLLRRVKPIEQLFKRITGLQMVQPGPYYRGSYDVWHLALHPLDVFRQQSFARQIADHLETFIGQLEHDPSLLDSPRGATNTQGQPSPTDQVRADPTKVFVVHGRNELARTALFAFLRSIGLQPIEWSQAVHSTGKASPHIWEILEKAFSEARAVVVLFTPDDLAKLHPAYLRESDEIHEYQLTGQARTNVYFEAGMAMAKDESRTVLVELGRLRPFSDVAGRHVVRIDDSPQRRKDLAQRLAGTGCTVDTTGNDWLAAGDFNSALPLPEDDSGSDART